MPTKSHLYEYHLPFFPARRIIKTFITIKKIPSVNMVIGNVSMMRMGFNIAFKKASTKRKNEERC